MHDLLKRLAGFRPGETVRYGLPLLLVGLATLLRLVAPLDVAPFLFYLPIIFLITLGLGQRAGLASLVVSSIAAAYFFMREESGGRLSTGEIVALVQYVIVGGVMVAVCGSLRRAFIENERTLAHLDAANRVLSDSRVGLEVAKREAEEAQLAAEQANHAKSFFLANMSHELRTPLSAIIGYSEMMLEEIDDRGGDDQLGDDIRKIEGNARHLLGLINDVLDLSKVESGKMDVYAEEFDVEEMLRDLATTVGSLIAKKGNSLDLRIPAGIGSMHTDLTKVRQLLLNLLGNAAKFTERGAITLTAFRTVGEDGRELVSFAVADTGIGMTDEQVANLFQRFRQADSSTTRKFGGTGLGLSLTKAFADILGGTVSVESSSGQGSVFTLSLPATYVPPAGEAALDAAGPEDAGRDLILVIDDDADQRALIARFLRREGFGVRVAGDGRTGLGLARQLRPRAILLDVMMPGIDGWSVLSELKADRDLSAIPVVMVTAVDERSLASSLGASDYMLKPVNWDRLGRVMERFRAPAGATPVGRVLLIEDDAITRLSVRASLEDAGWLVTEAENGKRGLEQASAQPPDVVLVDLQMPVMDGFTFLPQLRTLPGCADIPVIVVTGQELTPEDRRILRGASQVLNRGDLSLTALVEKLHGMADRAVAPEKSHPAA